MRRLRTIMPILALAVGALLSGRAWAAEPRTIADCEKIQAADAYNQCLAKFGPESKVKNLEPEKPSDFKSSGAEAAASANPLTYKARAGRGRHGARHQAGGGGRKRASFTVSHRRRHR